MRPDRKSRFVKFLERYLVNPPTRLLLWLGIPIPLALLETTGRHTGRRRRVPVMNGLVDGEFWIIVEHGRRAGYVRNIEADPRVRIRRRRTWMEGKAEVVEGDDPLERAAWIAAHLHRSPKLEVLANRLLATEPVTVRVELLGKGAH